MDWKFLSRTIKNQTSKSLDIAAQKTDYGLHTLIDKDPEAAECIDIVAVHGLNGHYLNTWRDEDSGHNWLEKFIPFIVTVSRVMSFWYNSTLQFSKSTSDILVFSDQLLESLEAKRSSIEEQGRPIIFICHSLGGLVFKRAFIKANEDEKYMLLKKSIHSVFFFGTPHRGSSLAQWGTIMAQFLKTASLGTSTNTRLSKDLEPDSRLMDYISESFRLQCGNLKVVSCYETKKLGYLNSLVVEHSSAILGLDSEIVIPIESDHREMCRFSDINEERFQPIKSRLDTLARSAKKSAFVIAKDALMSRLNTTNYESHRTRNPPPVKGSCTWVFHHPKYQAWLKATNSSLLWFSADPGCGKSVLASSLVNKFKTSSLYRETNICYFFFKSDNADQSDILNGVRAILHQLYSQQHDLIPFGSRELQGHKSMTVENLWTTFELSIMQVEAKPTICILDGIDECDPRPRGLLLRCISDFFVAEDKLPTAQATPKLKILITSRPENQIKILLERRPRSNSFQTTGAPPEPHNMIRLRAEDETDAISHDVSKLINTKIDDLMDRGFPVTLLENLQLELTKRADRTFLWISLVLSLLEEKVEGGASRRELDDILKTRDIYSVYAELLASRPDLLKARKMLNIILAAAKPLTVKEISIALAVIPEKDEPNCREPSNKSKRPKKMSFLDVEYELVYPFENHLKHTCGHFIRIIRNKVYLVHETAREFLLKPSDSYRVAQNNPRSSLLLSSAHCREEDTFQHTFSLVEAHALLLEICVDFLYCLARPTKITQIGQVTKEAQPFLQYAAQCWTIHHHHASGQLDPRDSQYYQNLCHPLFPGFHSWIKEFWHPRQPPHPLVSAPDDIQDYYINFFALENPLPSSCDTDDEDDGEDETSDEQSKSKKSDVPEESEKQTPGAISFERAYHRELSLPLWYSATECLSSNPGSLRNHNFPLKMDDCGLVSLDFEKRFNDRPPKD
ncbi:ankyrin repeat protein [Colletotrichum salicis]|uniref:Ankyrin repeat protein n=1 Tax=Colletotrichum salicis TaxID=1209931 RepID=A0A135U0Z7_9PEZI|nr:ankyrin repeat protein [Colletotrichum salicis]